MTTVTAVSVTEETPRGDGTNYIVFSVLLSTGETIVDGPRFLPASTNLSEYGAIVGQRVLDRLVAQELQQWP